MDKNKNKFLSVIPFAFLMLSILVSIYGNNEYTSISELRVQYANESLETDKVISSLYSELGYGGFIHDFKNLVIRHDIKKYGFDVQVHATHIEELLNELARINEGQLALEHISIVRSTVQEYLLHYQTVKRLINQGVETSNIDKVVKVDDGPALQSLRYLQQVVHEKFENKQSALELRKDNALGLMIFSQFLVLISIFILFMMYAIYNQNLVLSLKKERRANDAKSNFLSSMSHELRTPLNAIMGFSQLLELDDNLSSSQKGHIQKIHKSGNHLLHLINDVLDLSAIDSGQLRISLETVDLESLTQSSIDMLKGLATKREIQLEYGNLEGYKVKADHIRLKQVLINLITNAIKYNHTGGSVSVIAEVNASKVRISVVDTGYGIEPGQIPHLFEDFNRLGRENGDIEGTGIGLSLTKRLVELMGGIIGVESTPGKGSCFWVELPLAENTVPQENAPKLEQSNSTNQDIAKQTVLYIEDNPSNIHLMEAFFSIQPNLKLITAHSPSLGLELVASKKPSLILLDINLPEMDGYAVLKQLQQNKEICAIPVIAVTANAMPKDIEQGKNAGFYDYLTRPLDLVNLKKVVESVFE